MHDYAFVIFWQINWAWIYVKIIPNNQRTWKQQSSLLWAKKTNGYKNILVSVFLKCDSCTYLSSNFVINTISIKINLHLKSQCDQCNAYPRDMVVYARMLIKTNMCAMYATTRIRNQPRHILIIHTCIHAQCGPSSAIWGGVLFLTQAWVLLKWKLNQVHM